jgi:hypothetical protein
LDGWAGAVEELGADVAEAAGEEEGAEDRAEFHRGMPRWELNAER